MAAPHLFDMFARSIQVSQLQLTLGEKLSEYGVFSGPYLSVFGLNTKSVQIWSFFWFVFSCIRTKYIECPNTEFFLVQIQENTDQKKTCSARAQIFKQSDPWNRQKMGGCFFWQILTKNVGWFLYTGKRFFVEVLF